MKPRLYLFLSSLVSVLRIITFWLRNIPFHSLKILKFPSRRSARFHCVLITTPNKENTCSYFYPLQSEIKKNKQTYFLKKFKNLISEVCLMMCVVSRQIVSKGLMDAAICCYGSSCTATDCNYTPARKAGADPQRGK